MLPILVLVYSKSKELGLLAREMWPAGVILGGVVAVLTIFIIHWIYRWRNPRGSSNGGVLPPGSMGWPLIGETLHLLIPSRSLDLHPFIKKRIQRYIYITHIGMRMKQEIYVYLIIN